MNSRTQGSASVNRSEIFVGRKVLRGVLCLYVPRTLSQADITVLKIL